MGLIVIPSIPLATYRLQFTRDFGFDDAARLVPYLRDLGISHLYASPFLKARPGSTHGYDVVDHNQLNPELGGDDAFDRLSQALAAAGMGLILDFVPNHMGVGHADNAWWLDVLEWGPRSPHARSFDIDWDLLPFKPEGGVLLPILGQPYGDALAAGEIRLGFDPDEGSFSAWYFDHRLPIRPNRYSEVIRTVVAAAEASDTPAGRALLKIAAEHSDPRAPSREKAPAYKAALAAVEGGAEVIARGLAAYHVRPGEPASVLTLHRLLERQHYRVSSWRVASSEINYRRFFDVNDLAGLREEDVRTFAAVHRLVARLIADDRLHGLRLDHIDGLSNPGRYCGRLQRLVRTMRGGAARPFYTVVEKILAEGEDLPRLPGVAGTTGYEWLNLITHTLVDPRGLPALDAAAEAFTGDAEPFESVVKRAKRHVLRTMLSSEFTVLARLLARIAAGQWRTRDFTYDRLREALELYIIHFPIYRTYITAEGATEADRAIVARTIGIAKGLWRGADVAIFDLLHDALTRDLIGSDRQGYSRARVRRFALKVQQFTGPMMAKSLEDTAFYRYIHLLALNEVGGEPRQGGVSVAEFHTCMARRERRPHGLTATATHDTKRGEDARTRILALSELPDEWAAAAAQWAGFNAALVTDLGGRRAPSRTHEYMFYQGLLGVWPLEGPDASFIERVEGYALKAAREGKVETNWTDPDEAYEAAWTGFVRAALDPARSAPFLQSFAAFAERAALLGALNSLTQLTLKATMPGVPDFYQGTEFWDLSMVDPDNRRTVAFGPRIAALGRHAEAPDWPALAASWRDGHIKLALTQRLLALRARFPDIFTHGRYHALRVAGQDADNVIAFSRSVGTRAVVVVAGRHFAGATEGGRRWFDPAAWQASIDLTRFHDLRSVLTPEHTCAPGVLALAELCGALPVAILEATALSRHARESMPAASTSH
jgi:(1->4)-alpha-D-glucan 1-alpha-D-glucosylmutase